MIEEIINEHIVEDYTKTNERRKKWILEFIKFSEQELIQANWKSKDYIKIIKNVLKDQFSNRGTY